MVTARVTPLTEPIYAHSLISLSMSRSVRQCLKSTTLPVLGLTISNSQGMSSLISRLWRTETSWENVREALSQSKSFVLKRIMRAPRKKPEPSCYSGYSYWDEPYDCRRSKHPAHQGNR